MFAFAYLPQAAVLTVFNGPLAALTTILLVLSESSTIFSVLSKSFLIDDALIDTFDGVRNTIYTYSRFSPPHPPVIELTGVFRPLYLET